MRKRLSILLLVLPALLLGGCALQPAYRYNANTGGGYYVGQSPYGHADTVIEGTPSGWWGPWGAPYAGWYGFGPWIGYGGFSVGVYGRYYRHPYYRAYGHSIRRSSRDTRRGHHRTSRPVHPRDNAFQRHIPAGALHHRAPPPDRRAPVRTPPAPHHTH